MTPLVIRSTFSLLRGLPRTEAIPALLAKKGLAGAALADLNGVSGIPTFVQAMKKAGLKAIAGCEFSLVDDPKQKDKGPASFSTLVVLARDQAGWKALMRAVSLANDPQRFHRRPRLSPEELASVAPAGGWLVLAGRPGSLLAASLFAEPRHAHLSRTVGEAESHFTADPGRNLSRAFDRLASLFGDALRVEVVLTDPESLPVQRVVADHVRALAREKGVPVLAGSDAHYGEPSPDSSDQRLLVCSHLKATLRDPWPALAKDDDYTLGQFFRSPGFALRRPEEMAGHYTAGELAASEEAAGLCGTPVVGGQPYLPTFDCPPGHSPDSYFTELCREGWRKKVEPILRRTPASERPRKKREYADRIKMELEVLTGAGFSTYFLIVQDYIRYARESLKSFVGPGRGSSAGSLAAFLLDITRVDPLEYGLLFERFVNKGRLEPGKVSLPDIDTDFQTAAKGKVIDYLRRKYGSRCVSQMCNFSRLKGRSALREVLRTHGRCTYEELNAVTDPVPDEAAIADDLQQMREEDGEASIIRWAVEHHADALREWVSLRGGELDGPFAPFFAQAIRLEGVCHHLGKHASGVVVTPVPVEEISPLVFDKSDGGLMTGFDMKDAEGVGLTKVDILAVGVLDKLSLFERLVRTGRG